MNALTTSPPRLAVGLGLLAAVVLAAPSSALPPVQAIQARGEIPEEQLLDVGILLFDPGLPADDPGALEDQGIYPDVRRAEARYLALQLMDTLQSTGQWGAVRLVPAEVEAVDLLIAGTILESTGRKLALEIRAADAAGRPWLKRKYKELADPRAYRDDEQAMGREPFQNLYNHVANDLLEARRKRSPEELTALREVTALRFAAELVPAAFADYLEVDRKGRTVLARLPAADDPLLARIYEVRQRDQMFIDLLTEHYANFRAQMAEAYDDWRKFSYQEEEAQAKLKREARLAKILGAVGIVGGAMSKDRGVRDVGVIGGTLAVQAGMAKSQEAKIHVEALRELAASFDAEVAPMLIELEGQTVRLSGSVEAQFAEWRRILRRMFVTETGLPVDPNDGSRLADDP